MHWFEYTARGIGVGRKSASGHEPTMTAERDDLRFAVGSRRLWVNVLGRSTLRFRRWPLRCRFLGLLLAGDGH